MSSQRNIVILGGSVSGLAIAHYYLKHTLPTLKAKNDGSDYHLYLVNASSDWYFRVASPRATASSSLLPAEKLIFDIPSGFKQYSSSDFTFVQATATGLDTDARKVKYTRKGQTTEEDLSYHALVIATGSNTYAPAYSQHTDTAALLSAIKTMNESVKKAKDIVIVGGGPTAVESAGELGEFLNGTPGWFSTPERKVNITLVTAANQLLPTLRPDIAKTAEKKLNALGVDVVYNTHVADVKETNSKTTITLTKGKKLEADLYIPAYGVQPNSSWLPAALLNDKGYLVTNEKTLRVDAAGPRVYSIGDVASYSRNTIIDILDSQPVLHINLARDLLSYDPAHPTAKPKGKDRELALKTTAMMIVPVGRGGGVGEIMGWKVPSLFVWLIKGRDFMLGMSGAPTVNGDMTKKAVKWTAEERV